MNDRKFITTGDDLPKWSNPISHAVVVNNMCYISGQLSVNLKGEYVSGTAKEEAELAFKNVFAVAKESGFDKTEIVYIDIAFSDLNELQDVNDVYMDLFPEGKRPARTVYEASALPFGGKVKIVATAVKNNEVN